MRIKDFLEVNDVCESEFAAASGVPPSTLNQLLHGGGMTIRTAAKIIDASKSPRWEGEVTLDDLVSVLDSHPT